MSNTGNGTWLVRDNAGNDIGNMQYVGNTATMVRNYNGVSTTFELEMVSYGGTPIADLNNLYGFDKTTGLTISKNGTTYQREYALDVPQVTLASSMGTATYNTANHNITANLGNGDSVR